jgi:hypothetical protein
MLNDVSECVGIIASIYIHHAMDDTRGKECEQTTTIVIYSDTRAQQALLIQLIIRACPLQLGR